MKFKLCFIAISAIAIDICYCLQQATSVLLRNKIENDIKTENAHLIDSLDPQIYGQAFLQRVRELQVFKEIHGHCLVPKRYRSNPTLGNFVNKIRQQLRKYEAGEKSSITPERIALLDHMGFRWDGRCNAESAHHSIQSANNTIWMERFLELKKYMDKEGELMQSDSPLGSWTSRQRVEKKRYDAGEKSSLTAERIQLLDSIQFCWDPREKVWNERIKELINFKQEYGHCVVPTQYNRNRQLGSWVCTQRKLYKAFMNGSSKEYSEDRIKQLTDIGFVWNRWDYESEKWQI